MTTARQNVKDNDRVTPADPFDFGAGHVDARRRERQGLDPHSPASSTTPASSSTPHSPAAWTGSVVTQATATSSLASGVPSAPADLNLPSIGIRDIAGSRPSPGP